MCIIRVVQAFVGDVVVSSYTKLTCLDDPFIPALISWGTCSPALVYSNLIGYCTYSRQIVIFDMNFETHDNVDIFFSKYMMMIGSRRYG